MPDTDNPSSPLCLCSNPLPRVGISVGYWEPIRLVDVTRKPFCFVSLGGVKFDVGQFWGGGAVESQTDETRGSFYDVHWYVYPLIYWLELLTDALCLESGGFDIAYLTELDPLWRDDELAFILNPEAVLFNNRIAQAACGADCLRASRPSGMGVNALFWCAGCQGTLYPLDGWVQAHVGGVQASVLLLERMTYKLHREGLLWRAASSGAQGLCAKVPAPLMKKQNYRYQMTYPKPSVTQPFGCQPYGRSTSAWGAGRSYPVKGEDFGYLIFRKRNCCAL